MDNETLVREIQEGINFTNNMGMLYEQNKRLLYKMCRRYAGYADMDDLLQECYFALVKAVNHWDHCAGAKFMSYAGYWVQQQVQAYIAADQGVSEHTACDLLKYRRLQSRYQQQTGEPLTDEQAALLLHMSIDQVTALKSVICVQQAKSIDSLLTSDDDVTMGDTVASSEDLEGAFIDQAADTAMKEALWGAVSNLEDRQGEIITRKYKGGQNRPQMATETGLTVSQVQHAEHQGLKALRRNIRLKSTLEELDYIDTHAWRSSGIGAFTRTLTSSTEYTAIGILEGWSR